MLIGTIVWIKELYSKKPRHSKEAKVCKKNYKLINIEKSKNKANLLRVGIHELQKADCVDQLLTPLNDMTNNLEDKVPYVAHQLKH
jgi:hypothetical protein